MNIWIVDDDVSFAYDLKKELKSKKRKLDDKKEEVRVEVFPKASLFLEALKKKKKEPARFPHLVFLDVQFPDQSGLDIYLHLLGEEDPVCDVIHFCSSMSYGLFQRFFEERNRDIPPFVQKSRVKEELDDLLDEYLTKKEKKGTEDLKVDISLPLPIARPLIQKLDGVIKNMVDVYYSSGMAENVVPSMKEDIEQVSEFAGKLNLVKLGKRAGRLLDLFQLKTAAGKMRLRKEIKDLLNDAEKILEMLKNK